MIAKLKKPQRRKAAKPEPVVFGPESNGILMTPEEFDAAEFDPLFRYELIHGVLVVTPPPLMNERDPNEELGRLLRNYRQSHPRGHHLDHTIGEQGLKIGPNRRRADRAIWCGLGRPPFREEPPQIAIELVSKGKRNRVRDYEEKLREYPTIGVKEYLIFDRFEEKLTIHFFGKGKTTPKVLGRKDVYTTSLLPGFELPLAPLFDMANQWDDAE